MMALKMNGQNINGAYHFEVYFVNDVLLKNECSGFKSHCTVCLIQKIVQSKNQIHYLS